MLISDELLMLAFQRGSRDAFEELYARYRPPLHGFFRRRLESESRADDLVQETFIAVVRAIRSYEPRATVKTYLYAIALKLVVAERRKQAHDLCQPIGTVDPARCESPDRVLWVRDALHRLQPEEREILMLREYEQFSYSEIAQLLRMPVNTVRSRLFRARMALKTQLEPERLKAARSTGVASPLSAESEA